MTGAMTLPRYYYSVQEFSNPLQDSASLVYQSGLRLSNIQTDLVSCPFAADFLKHGNAAAIVKAYVLPHSFLERKHSQTRFIRYEE